MPFLRGNFAFERFNVNGFQENAFSEAHIAILGQHTAGRFETAASENVQVGFLGGGHLFDSEFDLGKNLIHDALHFSIRIDTNQIPSAIRKAWLQIELSGLARDNESGIPTKAQRKEAKEAVEQRCQAEAESGKYRKMQQFPLLWDNRQGLLYFGGSLGAAAGHCIDLLERSFGVQFSHVGAGTLAQAWAIRESIDIDRLTAANFVTNQSIGGYAWQNEFSQAPDFLGNEFLMWLWWSLENESDTIRLPDESEITVMMTKTLTLECPFGEWGKETITAESPVKLPESMQAIRAGKLPRKTGLTVVREGRQFDLVLNAESLGVSGAKIHLQDDEEFGDEDRIDAIRLLGDSIDQLFLVFCRFRSGPGWSRQQEQIRDWLHSTPLGGQQAAA